MPEPTLNNYDLAVRDFHRARKAAVLQQLMARLKGQSVNLLDYETTLEKLKQAEEPVKRGLKEIPLKKIVGSVGRYQDFTCSFLPKNPHDEERWAKVKMAISDMSGMPPIDVYQIGDAYFVLDGNHRVSVARRLGVDTISAYVTEVKTRVPLSADDDLDEVICKAKYADFLEKTGLDREYPDIDLLVTVCGQYRILLEQICAERHAIAQNNGVDVEEVPCERAAKSWYESVYLPVLTVIREFGALRRFPGRTETDIYLLLSQQLAETEETLGWRLDLQEKLPTLLEEKGKSSGLLTKVVGSVIPTLGGKEPVGAWRSQQLAMHRENRLFADMLLLFEGIEEDWLLLEAAIKLALDDKDRLLALHIVDRTEQAKSPAILKMADRFRERCREVGLVGEFSVEVGNPLESVIKRAAWSDLLLVSLTHPPESNPLARLRSFWGPLIERSPRPLLVTPHARPFSLSPMLLPYDGSPKANEALFIATYNAARWQNELTVLSVQTAHTDGDKALALAKAYLEEHGVYHAKYLLRKGEVGPLIIETATASDCNTIIMGGFGLQPVMRLMLGSSIEYVLQHTTQAVLICR